MSYCASCLTLLPATGVLCRGCVFWFGLTWRSVSCEFCAREAAPGGSLCAAHEAGRRKSRERFALDVYDAAFVFGVGEPIPFDSWATRFCPGTSRPSALRRWERFKRRLRDEGYEFELRRRRELDEVDSRAVLDVVLPVSAWRKANEVLEQSEAEAA